MAVQYNKNNRRDSRLINDQLEVKRNNTYISEEAINFFKKYEKSGKNLTKAISNVLSQKGGFNSFIKDSKITDKSLIQFLLDTNYVTKNLSTFQKWMSDKEEANTATNLPNSTKKLGSFSTTLKNSLTTMGIETAINFAAETVISSLSDALQKAERLEESGKNIVNNFGSLQDSYSQDSSTLSALQSEYNTLSEGVDSFGRNVSLTNEEYARYKDIMLQVSSIMPEIAMRYDSQGNAVSALTGKMKDLNKEYQKTQRQKVRDLFNQKDDNGNNIYDVMNYAEIESESNPFLKEGKRIVSDYSDMFDSFQEGDYFGALKKSISNNFFNGFFNGPTALPSYLYHLYQIVSEYISEPIDEQIKELTKDIESGKYQGAELGKKQGELFDLQQQQKEKYDVWKTYANGYAQLYDPDNDGNSDFFGLEEEAQGFLTSFFANMSPDFIEENGLTSKAAVTQFVSQWIDGLSDEDGNISKAFHNLLDFDIDTKDMTPEEIKQTIDSLIQNLLTAMKAAGMDIDDSGIASFKTSLGFKFVDENAAAYKDKLNYFNTKEEKDVTSWDEHGNIVHSREKVYDHDRQQELSDWSQNSNVTAKELESLKNKGYNAKSSIDELNTALTELRNNSQNELAPKAVWDSLDSDSKDTLLDTAYSCQLTGDKIKELAKNNKELKDSFKATGMSAEEFARSIREVNIDNLGNDIDDYENALKKIRNGESLSAEETANLISKNDSLAGSVKKTKDGYKIEESALLSVINASKEKYNVVVSNELLETEKVINSINKKIKAYKTELKSVQTAIEARQHESKSLIKSGKYEGKEDDVSRAILGNSQAIDDYVTSQELSKKTKKEQKRLKKLRKYFQKLQRSLDDAGGSDSSSKSPNTPKQKETKQEIDWISRLLDQTTTKVDLLSAKLQNLFSIKSKNSNLNKQIKETTKLINSYGKAASNYEKKAKSIKLSSGLKKLVKNGKVDGKNLKKLIKKYGEEDASKIQAYQNWYDKAQSAQKSREEQIAKRRELKQQKYQNYVDLYNTRTSRAEAKEAITVGAKEKNDSVNTQIKNLKESYKYQIAIAGLTKNKAEQERLEYELEKKITDLKVHKIDNLKKEYENKIGQIDNDKQDTQNEVSLLEAKGRIVTANYYKTQNMQEQKRQNELKNELRALQGKLNSNTFTKGSDEWYQLQADIQSVENSINECSINIVENSKKLGELHNAMLDAAVSNNNNIASEADFLAGLMGNNLTDENSQGFTKEGMGVLGSYGIGLKTAENSAGIYEKERTRLEKLLSSGSYGRTNDEYQSKKALVEAIQNAARNQQDAIRNAYEYENKIADLMKENYQAQLDYMKKIIDAKKNVLSLEKDLYDYERNISNQTKNIAALEKQYAALQGDTSEEGRARRASLQASIDEARQELQDTEYDKYISDQQTMLDNLYTEYEDLMNNLFKDQNQLLKEGIALIDSNSKAIKSVLDDYSKNYGYAYTSEFSDVISALGSEGSIANVLTAQTNRIITAYSAGGSNNGNNDNNTSDSSGFTVTKPDGSKAPGQHSNEWSFGGSTVMDDLAKENAEDFITDKDNLKEPKKGKKKDEYSAINQVVWERNKKKKKKVLKEGKIKELAGILGVKYDNATKTGNLYKRLKQLKVKGFKRGGIARLIQSEGEDGIAMVRNGEGFIAPEDVSKIQELIQVVPSMTDFIQSMTKLPISQDSRPSVNTFGDIHFDKIELPNVQNADDFVTALQTDKKVQRALGVSVHDLMTKGRITSNIQRV